MDYELEIMTFDNCADAYEIDRTDIPYRFVEDVPTLISTLKYGADNNLAGHAFLAKLDGNTIATIMLGEGITGPADPVELQNRPFYRLMFFVIDKRYRGQGYGTKILEDAIGRIYDEFGERPILLEVQKENEAAAQFYERNGFRKTTYKIGDDRYFVRNTDEEEKTEYE